MIFIVYLHIDLSHLTTDSIGGESTQVQSYQLKAPITVFLSVVNLLLFSGSFSLLREKHEAKESSQTNEGPKARI